MLTRMASPSMMVGAGQIVELPDGVANELIANGFAELVVVRSAPMIETAALDRQTETAVKPKPVKKKR